MACYECGHPFNSTCYVCGCLFKVEFMLQYHVFTEFDCKNPRISIKCQMSKSHFFNCVTKTAINNHVIEFTFNSSR